MKEKQDIRGMRLVTEGMGVDMTFPSEQMSTPTPIIFSPFDKVDDIALLQGGISATAVENGLAIKFLAPFGYFVNDENFPPMEALRGRWERNAFYMAYHVYNAVLNRLSDPAVKQRIAKVDGSKQLHIELGELAGLVDQINLYLQETFAKTYRLREERGYYRWIGLAAQKDGAERPPTTVMVIPSVIEGSKNIFLRANTVPFAPDSSTPMIPFDSNIHHAVISGLVHGVEGRQKYTARTAIRAAFLDYVFKGDLDLQKLIAATSRAGMFPRLGSECTLGDFMWKRVAALGIAYDFFKRNYIPTPASNIGEVRYIFSGSGFTKVLEDAILTYLSAGMLTPSDQTSLKSGGLFFLPSTNDPDASFRFSFCMNTDKEKYYTTIHVTDLKQRIYMKYHADPLNVSRDGMLNVSEDQQKEYGIRPVTIEPIHSVRQEVKYLGAGFENRSMIVKDRLDETGPWQPSELLRILTLGWAPAYTPSFIMLCRNSMGAAKLDEFRDFNMLTSQSMAETKEKK
jgi:hypothetical protein